MYSNAWENGMRFGWHRVQYVPGPTWGEDRPVVVKTETAPRANLGRKFYQAEGS